MWVIGLGEAKQSDLSCDWAFRPVRAPILSRGGSFRFNQASGTTIDDRRRPTGNAPMKHWSTHP